MPIIDCIKSDFAEEIVNHCSERSCKLELAGQSNSVILKGERICNDFRGKRYDIIPKKCGSSFFELILRLK